MENPFKKMPQKFFGKSESRGPQKFFCRNHSHLGLTLKWGPYPQGVWVGCLVWLGRVLLVDADLRRGLLHKQLGVRATPGLAEILNEEVSAKSVIVPGADF